MLKNIVGNFIQNLNFLDFLGTESEINHFTRDWRFLFEKRSFLVELTKIQTQILTLTCLSPSRFTKNRKSTKS